MAKAKSIYNRNSSKEMKGSDYELMIKLEYGKKELNINELLDLKNYLEFILHKIKITDLLIGLNLDFEKQMKDEY
jgi:hypothetical protein